MARKPNFQAAASRSLNRLQRPPGSSGIGHTPNPVHHMPPPPALVNHLGFQGIQNSPDPALPQEQLSGTPIIPGLQSNLGPGMSQPGIQSDTGVGPMLPGGIADNPNINGQPGVLPNLDEGSFYTDPESQIQYQMTNGQLYQLSGTTPGTYNGLPYGSQSLTPGQQGYVSPNTPLNQIPGYQSLDAQGNNLNSGPPLDANYDSLKQTILATQQAKSPDANVISPVVPTTPQVQQPVVQNVQSAIPAAAINAAPVNPQQLGNRNIPGFQMGKRLGNRGGGFGEAATRMLGRGRL